MPLGEHIKKARKHAGLTQAQLAERLGVATITIRQYELGKRQPRFEQLTLIADALDVSVSELLGSEFRDTVPPGWKDLRSPEEIEADVETFKQGFHSIQASKKAAEEAKETIAQNIASVNYEGIQKIAEFSTIIAGNPQYQKVKKTKKQD